MYDKVIFVSLDTFRSDIMPSNPFPLWPGKYSVGSRPTSTALDELAARAAYFPNCISAAPYTSASHATFFTGLWPHNHGVYEFFNRGLARDTIFTLGRRLGYRTVFKVDFPIILGRHLGFDRDIDDYLVEEDEPFLDAVEATDRVIAFAHFGGAHIPYGFHNLRFGGRHYRERVQRLEQEINLPFQKPGDQLVETYRDAEDLDLLFRYKRVVQHHYENAHYDKLFEMYLEGANHFLQNRFEAFLDRLLKVAARSRTLIVIFADHGEEYDADSYGHHNTLNEGVLRVPVIFVAPDVRPGIRPARIRSVDILPTVLARMGEQAALGTLDGSSLVDSVWGDSAYPERACFATAYTSDTAEFVAHQAQLLRTGVHRPTLRHVLYKEAVYLGCNKLVRQNYEYTEAGGIFGLSQSSRPDQFFEQEDVTKRWTSVPQPPEAQLLRSALDEYGRSLSQAPTVQVTGEVRTALQNMGYRI
jgi:choline-sulfatase